LVCTMINNGDEMQFADKWKWSMFNGAELQSKGFVSGAMVLGISKVWRRFICKVQAEILLFDVSAQKGCFL
ncbi:hypothetical protein U1Q18_049278, partial [Sarracenia purpurea var. burkii]